MAKMTLARIRKTVYPFPVYEAHFADGTVQRMSFWSQAGKPWSFDAGRRLCEHWRDTQERLHFHRTGHGALCERRSAYSNCRCMTAAKIVLRSGDFPTPNTPHKAIAGYIYHDGRRVADDPKFSGGVVAVPRKRVTAAQLRQRIAALAEQLEGGADPLQCAQAARKLLAA